MFICRCTKSTIWAHFLFGICMYCTVLYFMCYLRSCIPQRVPRSRTCSDAGIVEHFCTCQDTREVTWDDPVVDLAATFLMISLNNDLDPFPACVQFTEVRLLGSVVYIIQYCSYIFLSIPYTTMPYHTGFHNHPMNKPVKL